MPRLAASLSTCSACMASLSATGQYARSNRIHFSPCVRIGIWSYSPVTEQAPLLVLRQDFETTQCLGQGAVLLALRQAGLGFRPVLLYLSHSLRALQLFQRLVV